jgi:polysaccharide pyruvyl transferase WcaK-like protein
VNIGDIAHTPGMLRLLEEYLPGVSVILWANQLDRGVDAMLRRRFPNLRVVRNAPHWTNPQPQPDDPTLEEAMQESHLLLHGSGASVHAGDLALWSQCTGKPYGLFGVTLGCPIGSTHPEPVFGANTIQVLNNASFIFTRETTSLAAVRNLQLDCPHIDFVPDATFALDLANEQIAQPLLNHLGLEPERFICVIPRLRLTPYWEIYSDRPYDPEVVAQKQAINAAHRDTDFAKLRHVVTEWVRSTGLQVLLCPEMTYQVELARKAIYDMLPGDVKPHVAYLDRYWLTDEAVSVYKQARVVVSMECHSPIMTATVGRPAIYLRQATDTWKGQMYPDLGLSDWLLQLDTTEGDEIAAHLLHMQNHYPETVTQTATAIRTATNSFERAMQVIASVLGVN